MFIYQTGPQDYFGGMQTVKQAAKEYELSIDELIRSAMKCAYVVAKANGSYWEGDIGELRIIGLPDPDNCRAIIVFIWKQDNNGTTFICSPVELSWLSQDDLLFQP